MKKSNVFAWRIVMRRIVATTLIALAVSGNLAGAAPSDITSSVAPAIGADAPAGAAIKGNDAAVSSQTGALQYSYPITVSPGRNGMQPALALSYSSQAPIYGGIATGWSLDVPEIRLDVSSGRLAWSGAQADAVDLSHFIDPRDNDKFVSTLAGGRPLHAVTDDKGVGVFKTYRAENDSSFARYDRMEYTTTAGASSWRVRTPDGLTHLFGENNYVDCKHGDWYAPLTTTRDQFGNTVHYTYNHAGLVNADDCLLDTITYGANVNAGLPNDTVTVKFNWDNPSVCSNLVGSVATVPPVGSQTDYRGGGPQLTGARPLGSITVTTATPTSGIGLPAPPVHVRTIGLSYRTPGALPFGAQALCNASFAPYRELASISETATVGSNSVTIPPVTFTYGSAAISRTSAYPSLPSSVMQEGVRWAPTAGAAPAVRFTYLDFNGDTRPDRLWVNRVGNECKLTWQKSTPSGWVTQPSIILPRLPWTETGTASDLCSLTGQHTEYANKVPTCELGDETPSSDLHYRWMDADGDGLPDLVTALRYGPTYNPGRAPPFQPWPTTANCTGVETEGCEVFPSAMMASLRDCNDKSNPCVTNFTALVNAENTVGGTARMACTSMMSQLHLREASKFGGCDNTKPDWACSFGEPPQTANIAAIADDPYPSPPKCAHGFVHSVCNRYPWWVYKNRGDGTLAPARVVLSTVALESDTGDSSMLTNPSGARHEIADLDGDGIADAVVVPRSNYAPRADQPPYWNVKLGDGFGGFRDRPGDHTFAFATPHGVLINATTTGAGDGSYDSAQNPPGLYNRYQTGLVVDLNGDGARDYVAAMTAFSDGEIVGNSLMSTAFSDGTQFMVYGDRGKITSLPAVSATQFTQSNYPCPHLGTGPLTFARCYRLGQRIHTARLLDIDADGRPDLVRKSKTTNDYRVSFNLGGVFSDANALVDLAARNALTSDGSYVDLPEADDLPASADQWRVTSDLLDLDGDGISEAINDGVVKTYDPAGHPPRLLYQISNGRGAVSTATYATMTSVAVEQHPESGKYMPGTMWVVSDLETVDVFANTSTKTKSFYKNPVFNKEPNAPGEPTTTGKWSFRGFEEVTTTGATGAKTVQRFGYGSLLSPDWSGRLTTTLTRSAEAPTAVVSISETQWGYQATGGGYITTYHPLTESKWTCKNGQDEGTCRGDPATFSKNSTTYAQLPATGNAQVWVASASQAQGKASRTSTALVDGDRTATETFALVSTATQYFLRGTATSSFVQTSAALVANGKTETFWTEGGLPAQYQWLAPIRQRTYFNATQYAESRLVYDWPTGNVLERWKPEQLAAATTKTTYTYDPYKLYALTETNEKGHAIDTLHDYGTGAVVSVKGPNIAGCAPTCSGPLKEEHNTTVDALGRPTSSAVTLSQDGSTYTLVTTATMSYNDNPVLSGTLVSTSMTSAKLVEVGGTVWTQDQADYDGNGRLLRTTQFANGAAAANAVTSYTYGNDGKLISVSTPDPTANDASVVSTLYEFDSLGRPTKIRLPDHADPLQRSAVLVAYDGTSSTTTEILRAADGVPAVKLSTVDAFGRLSTVSEQRTAGVNPTWAVTTLTYDGNDNVATITDPENVVTTMVHDWAGRRLQIGRDGKVWLYQYNRNGSMISEQVPGANPDGTDVLKFTNTTVYDDLDRMTSRVIGSRTLSTADQTLFGTRSYSYTWDLGGNRIGRIRYASASAPSAATPSVSFSYAYDAQGNRTGAVQGITIAGFPALQRNFTQTFTPNFGPAMTYFYDAMPGGTQATQARNVYDARGLPLRVDVYGLTTPAVVQQVAVQTRNVAGVVTKRRTDQLAAVGAMTFVESNWVYDKLGRPLSQTIARNAAGATVQVAKQQLAYFGNSDPKQLIHTLGASNTKTFTFSYDTRHQLTGVTTSGAAFTGGYTFGNAGRLSQANVAANVALPGSDVKQRNVNYVYGTGGVNGVDKEAVTALTNVSGGAAFASYLYDAAGNQTKRTYAAGNVSWDYVYDGEDQLRRVTKRIGTTVNGSEEYWYDENGGRLAIVYRDPAGLKTGLRWFIGGTEAYYTASGTGNNVATLTKAYTHPTLGTPVARVERTPTAVKIEYQFHGLGSNTLAAVGSDGVTNASFMYAPYGEVVEATDGGAGVGNGKDAHRRRVTDKYTDEIGGLMYYGARYYDGVLLGWTQGDPLYRFAPDRAWVAPRRGNLYQYVRGNPVRYIDPDGREDIFEHFFGRITEAAKKAAHAAGSFVAPVTDFIPGVGVGVRLGLGDTKEAAINAGTDLLGFGIGKLVKLAVVGKVSKVGEVMLDTDKVIEAVKGGEAVTAAILKGRTPIVSTTVVKQVATGGFKAETEGMRQLLIANGGRVVSAGTAAEATALQAMAKGMKPSRAIGTADARILAAAQREGTAVLTNDKQFNRFMQAIGWAND